VLPEHLAAFFERYEKSLAEADCIVMGGSLPKGVPIEFFAQAIKMAHTHEVPVIFDSSGPPLVAGVNSHPKLIKPNRTELCDLLGFMPNSPLAIQQAAKNLRKQFGIDVIVTLGEEGAITVFEGGSYFVQPLSIPVTSSAGAGDGVLAGMALAYSSKESIIYGLQHGFALAGAVLKTLATADFQIEEYINLLSQVNIIPL